MQPLELYAVIALLTLIRYCSSLEREFQTNNVKLFFLNCKLNVYRPTSSNPQTRNIMLLILVATKLQYKGKLQINIRAG